MYIQLKRATNNRITYRSHTTGFLLGKFVAERQYRIRQLQEAEYIHLIRELHTLRKSIEASSKSISDSSLPNIQTKYNRKLWDEAANCTHPSIEQNYGMALGTFIQKLVDNELTSTVQCFQRLRNIIKTIEIDSD